MAQVVPLEHVARKREPTVTRLGDVFFAGGRQWRVVGLVRDLNGNWWQISEERAR